MPPLLPIVLIASHLVLAADAMPNLMLRKPVDRSPQQELGVIHRRASEMNKTPAASSKRTGTSTPLRSAASAQGSPRLIAPQLRGIANLPGNGQAG